MMITQESIVLIHLAIGIAMAGWIFGKLWPQARRESFQQNLFRLRNDLFIFMAENGYSFDEPGYRFLRKKLNFMIRFAETFNVPTLLIASVMISTTDRETCPIDETADEKLRSELKRVHLASANCVLHFLNWSILGAPGICLFRLIALLRWKKTVPVEKLRPVRAYSQQAENPMLIGCG